MDRDNLKRSFPTFDDYVGMSLPNLNELESIFICLHNSGDSKLVQSKLWEYKALTEGEELFVQGLLKALKRVKAASNQRIFRYEVNLADFELQNLKKELKHCFENNIPFRNRAFWNFSAHDWKFEQFRIEVETLSISRAKLIYSLFGEIGESESEITYPPKCSFKVLEIGKRSALLQEMEY